MISSEKEYALRANDFDKYDRMRPSTVLDLFQDIAGINANMLGCGYDDMKKKGLMWVILRNKFDIFKFPELYSNVIVSSWPEKPGRADFDRNYKIVDKDGNLVAKGISKWCVCNYVTRRLMFKNLDMYNCDESEFVLEPTYPEGIDKIPQMDGEGNLQSFVSRAEFSELDHNGHVNNAKYADYILNALNLSAEEKVVHFEMEYVHEMNRGEEFEIRFDTDGNIVRSECWQGDRNVFKCRVGIDKEKI